MNDERISIASPQLGAAERDRIDSVIDSGIIADGPEVRGFEREFADYCGADHGVATSNGTTALHAALHALKIGSGDRVLTTPFTFIATANAVAFTGAEVGFVDIDPQTYNIDPDALESRLRDGEEVDAVIAVHLYGLPADITRLVELAETYDFALVEDAAQAHGAEVEGKRVGSFGDAACFSFYPTKNMTTSEGGIITTNRVDVAERAARFVDHGRVSGYEHAEVGHNFRMTSIAAAIGRIQLERLPGFTRARQANAAALSEYLTDAPVTTPYTPPDRTHVFHQYTVQCDSVDRDALKSYLDAKGISTGVYYPKPVHKQPAYEHLSVSAPVAEEAAERVLSLPIHPELSEADIERIGRAVTDYAEVVT
ncbi:DegT/DnrJ/EryC1/StrS family aminotransferase (plasmid) [Haloferax mediterranei ATCC 33500]|uniref:DegT/DnrJ/EryC1/StrS family aminotransferase n=1 Tax=Haloferax mediterranei (strain ATCC 33500 / DSM 1411 / JCM 8866 / NBRC 14739 / NCIMB 2177 / R-4) TaxID=523841 RepID=I3RAU1_HALMT|nr:DegT/DnrJ/EryC1/StrS family aminotransferase [Haloferax mediterranei]AFK21351.1 pleiotropic regulatory protein DegT [Haloferax mediterranei ATCC 33500]ELZ97322.1 pleiotropic regulatory protein DegT [Haloferax mediterranei ATCC 33500]MDX5990381.1 DegT/DnrJ/EryC1/StrS family aminotransferase [Haloferax mediterranei ATCC 33500]QCQ76959.1 DegT/DnrJ/EryC1/StrS family aminotransferase [Haloferax mediterranei ATCC 33500]